MADATGTVPHSTGSADPEQGGLEPLKAALYV